MNTAQSRSLALLPAVAAAGLTLTLLAQAAETAPARRALLTAPAASAASTAAPRAASAPRSARKTARPRALGGDDDLKDLEVERVRGKNR